jgi:hypothetical protein
MIRLFDVSNGVIIPTEHCINLRFLKKIMTEYPNNYMKIYSYLFYMCCPDPELNPFFHLKDVEKEDFILQELEADFSTEDDTIHFALQQTQRLYETETSRAYRGIKTMLDNLSDYMYGSTITDGKDGNITQQVNAAAKFDGLRQSYKGVFKDLMEEQKSTVRGGKKLAYDA